MELSKDLNFFERSLQWIVCSLHLNELPFRHLFDAIDGRTTGTFCRHLEVSKVNIKRSY